MSEDASEKGQEFSQMFQRAKDFTEDLLKENERLRFRLAASENTGAGSSSDDGSGRCRETANRETLRSRCSFAQRGQAGRRVVSISRERKLKMMWQPEQ